MVTFNEVLMGVKRAISEVTVEEARLRCETGGEPGPAPALLDVRERDEYEQGYVAGAHWIPRGLLEMRIEAWIEDRDRPMIVYCAGGVRSALAVRSLVEMGYTKVVSMAGGFEAWKTAGHEVARPRVLSAEQVKRYSRHLALPEVGESGQVKLLDAKVLCVGAGGLGSSSAIYLAAAGVGTIGIVDNDVVDESNLQRQILHNIDRLGRPKVESARETLQALNPDVRVVPHDLRLDRSNVLALLADYDLVVDGADNFPTRYLLNDAALKLGKPIVHGSVFRFEGRVTTFLPFEGPCYRCLYPEPPPAAMAPNCQEAGVLGVLPGMVGTLQASEALKWILGVGEPLSGKLMVIDALATEYRRLKFSKDPECPVCSKSAEEIQLIDDRSICRGSA